MMIDAPDSAEGSGSNSSSWDDASSAEEEDLLASSTTATGLAPDEGGDSRRRRRRRRRSASLGLCGKVQQRLGTVPGCTLLGRLLHRCCCNCNMAFLVCCNIWSAFATLILFFLGAVAFPTEPYRLPEIDEPEEARVTCFLTGVLYALCFGGTLAKIIVDKRNAAGPVVRRKRTRWSFGGRAAVYGQVGTDEKDAEDEVEGAEQIGGGAQHGGLGELGAGPLEGVSHRFSEDDVDEDEGGRHHDGIGIELAPSGSSADVTAQQQAVAARVRSRFKGTAGIPASLPLSAVASSRTDSESLGRSSSASSSSSSSSDDSSSDDEGDIGVGIIDDFPIMVNQ
eukprot:INCI17205.1.p1 GENE.INCI17205.1~~INCI17205.1.p1  ORF type:complete len:338 (-),score=58.28 INCI17205.1:1413-2426(-)